MRLLALAVSLTWVLSAHANNESADRPRKATTSEVFKIVEKRFESHCGRPRHCSMLIDPRGGCPVTVHLVSPEPLGDESRSSKSALGTEVYRAWVCLSPSGRILDVQFTEKTPWARS
jgi:hypothetical protein